MEVHERVLCMVYMVMYRLLYPMCGGEFVHHVHIFHDMQDEAVVLMDKLVTPILVEIPPSQTESSQILRKVGLSVLHHVCTIKNCVRKNPVKNH